MENSSLAQHNKGGFGRWLQRRIRRHRNTNKGGFGRWLQRRIRRYRNANKGGFGRWFGRFSDVRCRTRSDFSWNCVSCGLRPHADDIASF